MNEREKALKQLQMYNFALIDAMLFLDTHPKDRETLSYFKKTKKLFDTAKNDYEQKFGPISARSVTSNDKWEWVNSPWPWEVD